MVLSLGVSENQHAFPNLWILLPGYASPIYREPKAQKSTPLSVGQKGQNQHVCSSSHSRDLVCYSLQEILMGTYLGSDGGEKKKLKRNPHKSMFYGAAIPQRLLFIYF